MFRLKKLEIQGFKSFVEKTSLTLPGRITAIVGPNGSGKSNICDSVQWVLGEQSARALRGTTMEDVIFNGSARRRPLGMAEVSLTLEARGDHWAEHGGEVRITRRVSRDGESDYILNGKRSRLKDVQDLLLGTGLGVKAYSIIEQQKVDLILSTKPQDRRRLIEEAAGVSKYKLRKRQAEMKLEETRANLLRLSDIVSEIERTCTSLKRQASRAARWKEQADVLAVLKKTLARLRADRLAQGMDASSAALASALDAEARALADLGRVEAGLAEAQHRAEEDERSARALSDALASAREALLAAEAAVAAGEREAEEAEARRELLEAQKRDVESDHLRSGEEAARAAQLLETVEAELGGAEERAAAALGALEESRLTEEDHASRRENARRELLSSAARASEATNREREAALLVDRLGFALAKLEERKAQAERAVAERAAAQAAARGEADTAARALEAARTRLDETGIGRKGAEERLLALGVERDTANAAYHAMDKRIAALETTLGERESGGDGARKALAAAGLPAAHVLADAFEAREGFETALDAALGTALEAPVLASRDGLTSALAAVQRERIGAARFIHPIPDTPFPLKPHDERILGVARELLSPKSGSEALVASLPDALVVGSVEDALALAPLHPERTFVTKDGVVVRGALVESAGTEVPGEGLFTVRRDLKSLTFEREELDARRAALEAEIAGTASTAQDLAASLEAELAACRRAERTHSEAEARAKAAEAEKTRAEREAMVLREEETGLRTDLMKTGESRSEATRLAAQRTAEVAQLERTLAELETGVENARAGRLAASEGEAQARNARDVLKERRRAAADAASLHASRTEAAARRLADIADQLVEVAGRKQNAASAAESARAERLRLAGEASVAEQARAQFDVEAAERRLTREAADKGAHARRESLDGARRARFDAELLLERKKADEAHLLETCRNEFACAPLELPEVVPDADGNLPDETALAEQVTEKTLALERLGPVNHAALEEFDVESKRHQELSTQKLDLEKSLEQILETIKTINTTSAERFAEAFAAINANFAQLFQRLFRGGNASMALLDESDPLESGLEILAQPPGKRNQTIGLLSGGEKALTAVALLMAIFRYKPSPFCILDEVDAPLDEANIDRFTSLLNELSEETQFVLITHSKRTMETAQALYGVTQEEPGVSKLVSVRFD